MSSGTLRVISERDKSFPAFAAGLTIGEFVQRAVPLGEFSTPLLTLDARALANNLEVMAAWVADHGFELMPHGKTTMAPALWRDQLRHGATGITVATPWQARVALSEGVPAVLLANECVDPAGLRWIDGFLDAHPAQSFLCWVDSIDAVERMDAVLAGLRPERPLDVLVELGAPGGRTGARSVDEAARVAERVVASPGLELRGIAGYDGAVGHDRSEQSVSRIRAYLRQVHNLHQVVGGLVGAAPSIVSVGGSAFFDLVADEFAGVGDGSLRLVLRSGAYIAHDAGYYDAVSPLGAALHPDEPRLLPAMWGLARVLSHPEPGLVLLDGGRRDFPFDQGLPNALAWSESLGSAERPLAGYASAINDQHTFLHIDGEAPPVGAVVRLGLSHPCTAFDKWRIVPVVDAQGVVADVIETFF